jgi:hypothetical protein
LYVLGAVLVSLRFLIERGGCCLIKTLPHFFQGKERSHLFLLFLQNGFYWVCRSVDNFLRPMPWQWYWWSAGCRAFVRRSAWFSLDEIHLTCTLSPCCSCVKNSFGAMCLVKSPLMKPFATCPTTAWLSSYKVVGSDDGGNPQLVRMWLDRFLNEIVSLLASYRAINSAWFEEVAVRVCLQLFHEIAVPPARKT